MSKKKTYWYVLVITGDGPVFVTKVNNADRTAQWDMYEKPIVFSKEWATDLALGLTLNLHLAYAIESTYEIDTQPYHYEFGHFEWVENK